MLSLYNGQMPYHRRSCAAPWTTLVLDKDGSLSFCCYLKGLANIYEMSDRAFEEVWNGPVARRVRNQWVEGRLEGLRCANCPGLQRFGEYPHYALTKPDLFQGSNPAALNARLNLKEFVAGATRLQSAPLEIVYIPGVACNIQCIHCFQPRAGSDTAIPPQQLLRFYHLLGDRAILHLMSGGEPLVIPAVETLVQAISAEHRAGSEIILQTNGQLLKDRFRRFPGFKKYHVRISIDGYDKETYEYIHRGAQFERLLEGIAEVNEARGELDVTTSLVMVLMLSNFRNLNMLFDFADEHLFNDVWVTPVHAAYGKRDALRNENIFEFRDLLHRVPEWPDTLDNAIERSMLSGRHLACRHLEYIKGELTKPGARNANVTTCAVGQRTAARVPNGVVAH